MPGIGTPPLEKWSNGDGGIWLTAIPPTSAPDIAVYSFEHGIRPDEDFSWQTLFDQGAELLDGLIKLGDVREVMIVLPGASIWGVTNPITTDRHRIVQSF